MLVVNINSCLGFFVLSLGCSYGFDSIPAKCDVKLYITIPHHTISSSK